MSLDLILFLLVALICLNYGGALFELCCLLIVDNFFNSFHLLFLLFKETLFLFVLRSTQGLLIVFSLHVTYMISYLYLLFSLSFFSDCGLLLKR